VVGGGGWVGSTCSFFISEFFLCVDYSALTCYTVHSDRIWVMQLSLFMNSLASYFPSGSWARLSGCGCFVVVFIPIRDRPIDGLARALLDAGCERVDSRQVSGGLALCLKCPAGADSQVLALPRPRGGSRLPLLPW